MLFLILQQNQTEHAGYSEACQCFRKQIVECSTLEKIPFEIALPTPTPTCNTVSPSVAAFHLALGLGPGIIWPLLIFH